MLVFVPVFKSRCRGLEGWEGIGVLVETELIACVDMFDCGCKDVGRVVLGG